MKSPSGLPPQMAGMHQLSQQRTAAVLRTPKAFVLDTVLPRPRVYAEQVRGFQRSHLVAEAFLEDRVDLLGRRHVILQHKRGLVHEQMGNPVGHKARHVLDDDGFLAKHGKQPQQRVDGPVGGMEPANHLDGRFQMNRVHEVDAHHVGWTPGGAGYLRDRDTRRIGPKTHLAWRHSIQLLIDRLLDMPVLGHVLDDEVTRRHVLQIGREHHAWHGVLRRYAWQRLRQQGDAADVVQHGGLRALQDVLRDVHHDRGYPMQHQVGYDAAADVSRAQHADLFELHGYDAFRRVTLRRR